MDCGVVAHQLPGGFGLCMPPTNGSPARSPRYYFAISRLLCLAALWRKLVGALLGDAGCAAGVIGAPLPPDARAGKNDVLLQGGLLTVIGLSAKTRF